MALFHIAGHTAASCLLFIRVTCPSRVRVPAGTYDAASGFEPALVPLQQFPSCSHGHEPNVSYLGVLCLGLSGLRTIERPLQRWPARPPRLLGSISTDTPVRRSE